MPSVNSKQGNNHYRSGSGLPFESDLARLLLNKGAAIDADGVSADQVGSYDAKLLGVVGEYNDSVTTSKITAPGVIKDKVVTCMGFFYTKTLAGPSFKFLVSENGLTILYRNTGKFLVSNDGLGTFTTSSTTLLINTWYFYAVKSGYEP